MGEHPLVDPKTGVFRLNVRLHSRIDVNPKNRARPPDMVRIGVVSVPSQKRFISQNEEITRKRKNKGVPRWLLGKGVSKTGEKALFSREIRFQTRMESFLKKCAKDPPIS